MRFIGWNLVTYCPISTPSFKSRPTFSPAFSPLPISQPIHHRRSSNNVVHITPDTLFQVIHPDLSIRFISSFGPPSSATVDPSYMKVVTLFHFSSGSFILDLKLTMYFKMSSCLKSVLVFSKRFASHISSTTRLSYIECLLHTCSQICPYLFVNSIFSHVHVMSTLQTNIPQEIRYCAFTLYNNFLTHPRPRMSSFPSIPPSLFSPYTRCLFSLRVHTTLAFLLALSPFEP